MTEESTNPFLNLEELQRAHERLWDERPEGALPAGWRERVTELLDRGVATGTLLSDRRERQAAQQILNSWVAHLTDPEGDTPSESQALGAAEVDRLPRVEVAPVPVRVLARYDESTTNRVGERLNDWVDAVPQPEMRRAREVLQQLVRLRPDTADKFDSSPVLRATLYDLASAAEIDATLEQLVGLGVVAMERGDTPENDRFRLAHPELLARYPQLDPAWRTLRRWLDERVQFRQQVLQWHAAGRDRKQLVSGELGLDFARVYHDRNMLEREFIAESFGDEKRRNERERRKQEGQRRQLLMATVLIPVLTILTVWALRERARSKLAEQAATDAATVARVAEQAATEAATKARLAAEAETQATILARKLADQISDRSDLRRMLQILRALSEIGAARSKADLDVGLLQLRSILDQKDPGARFLRTIQQSLSRAFRKPPAEGLPMSGLLTAFESEAEDCWQKSLQETAASSDKRLRQYEESRIWKLFRRRLLNVAHAFRNSWLEDENEAAPADTPVTFRQEALQQIRQETYTRIRACVDALQSGLESGTYNDAAPFVREFWLNYWGEMGMFEGEGVMRAMVAVGTTLRGIEADLLQTVDAADPTVQTTPAPRLLPKQERVEIDKEIRWSRLNHQAPENRRIQLKSDCEVLKTALQNELGNEREPPQRITRYSTSE